MCVGANSYDTLKGRQSSLKRNPSLGVFCVGRCIQGQQLKELPLCLRVYCLRLVTQDPWPINWPDSDKGNGSGCYLSLMQPNSYYPKDKWMLFSHLSCSNFLKPLSGCVRTVCVHICVHICGLIYCLLEAGEPTVGL